MSERPGSYQRSFSGMVGAMAVLLAVVAAFVGFRALNRADVETEVAAVDYQATLADARTVARFPLLAPDPLPEGWKVTSATFDRQPPQSWHLGGLTDQGRYVGLEQARRPEAEMVAEHVDPDAVEGDPVTIQGATWRTWSDAGGDHALVRRDGGVTTLVVGTAGVDVLTEFVAILDDGS